MPCFLQTQYDQHDLSTIWRDVNKDGGGCQGLLSVSTKAVGFLGHSVSRSNVNYVIRGGSLGASCWSISATANVLHRCRRAHIAGDPCLIGLWALKGSKLG